MTLTEIISHLIRYKFNGTWYLIEIYSNYRIDCAKSNKKSCISIFKLEEFQTVVFPGDPIKTLIVIILLLIRYKFNGTW